MLSSWSLIHLCKQNSIRDNTFPHTFYICIDWLDRESLAVSFERDAERLHQQAGGHDVS